MNSLILEFYLKPWTPQKSLGGHILETILKLLFFCLPSYFIYNLVTHPQGILKTF